MCVDYEYEISVCEEEHGCARDLPLPEEVDFAVAGDKTLEEDEHCEDMAVGVVLYM